MHEQSQWLVLQATHDRHLHKGNRIYPIVIPSNFTFGHCERGLFYARENALCVK